MNEWTPERRAEKGAEIVAECEEVAERLGARGVVIIAMFEEKHGDGAATVHVLDGGKAPWPLADLYERMLKGHALSKEGLEGRVQ